MVAGYPRNNAQRLEPDEREGSDSLHFSRFPGSSAVAGPVATDHWLPRDELGGGLSKECYGMVVDRNRYRYLTR